MTNAQFLDRSTPAPPRVGLAIQDFDIQYSLFAGSTKEKVTTTNALGFRDVDLDTRRETRAALYSWI